MLSPECAASFAVLANTPRKVAMTLSRTPASTLALSALVACALAATTAEAGDLVDGARVVPAADRCAMFGPGFADMGNGTCTRAESHVRVQFGTHRAASEAWITSGTSSAALHSEGSEMMPGVGTSHQLHVRNALQSYDRY